MNLRILWLGLMLSLGPMAGRAQLSPEWTYQGRLTQGGEAAQGLYDMRFTLYPAAADGLPVGTPAVLSGVPVADGLFEARLNLAPPVWDGSPLWLQIEVRPAGSETDYVALQPRQPLRAAPYALYAFKAAGPVPDSELRQLSGITTNIQAALNAKLDRAEADALATDVLRTNGLISAMNRACVPIQLPFDNPVPGAPLLSVNASLFEDFQAVGNTALSPNLVAATGQRLEFAGDFDGKGTNLWQVTNGYLIVRHDLTNTDTAPRMQVTLPQVPGLFGATVVWRSGGSGLYNGSFTLAVTPRYVGSFATNLHVTFRRDSITVTVSRHWPEFEVVFSDYTGFGFWKTDVPVECYFERHGRDNLTVTAIQENQVYRRAAQHPWIDSAWGPYAYWQEGVQGGHSTNAQTTIYLDRIYAGSPAEPTGFDLIQDAYQLNQSYTNNAVKGWLSANVQLTPSATAEARLALEVVQHFSGISTVTNTFQVQAPAGTANASVQQITAPLQPKARFTFKDESAAGASAQLVPGSTLLVH
jgi:hypothetical protein